MTAMPMDEDVSTLSVGEERIRYTPVHGYWVQKRVGNVMEAGLTTSHDLCYYDLGDYLFLSIRYPSRLTLKPDEPRGL